MALLTRGGAEPGVHRRDFRSGSYRGRPLLFIVL
nr:MAG TPA: hypothetical protein [Caudoviricetes sp.]